MQSERGEVVMFLPKGIVVALVVLGASVFVAPSKALADAANPPSFTAMGSVCDPVFDYLDDQEFTPMFSEGELFQGIPEEDILPPGSEDPDAALDMPLSASQLGFGPEAFNSLAKARCIASCDRHHDFVLIPACKRVRNPRSRPICYANAMFQYSICVSRCPRR